MSPPIGGGPPCISGPPRIGVIIRIASRSGMSDLNSAQITPRACELESQAADREGVEWV